MDVQRQDQDLDQDPVAEEDPEGEGEGGGQDHLHLSPVRLQELGPGTVVDLLQAHLLGSLDRRPLEWIWGWSRPVRIYRGARMRWTRSAEPWRASRRGRCKTSWPA